MNWNRIKNPLKALVVIAIVTISLWASLPLQKNIHLGLDLQGGARLLLQLYPTADVPQITPQVQNETMQVIDNRINGLGVTEPLISKSGFNRILVELPQVKNPGQAEAVLKQVAVLEYKIVPPNVVQQAEADLQIANSPTATPKERAAAKAYIALGAYKASGPVVYSSSLRRRTRSSSRSSRKPISAKRWVSSSISAIYRRRSSTASSPATVRSPGSSRRNKPSRSPTNSTPARCRSR